VKVITTSLYERIPRFNKKEVEELKTPLMHEWNYYETLDQKRREIIGRFKEIETISGNWRFLNQVTKPLFKKLKLILEETCKCILNENKEKITREAWVDSWLSDHDYHDLENDETEHYYLFEALVSDFKDDFIKSYPYDENFTRKTFSRTIRKSRRRILNILYYFHQKAIARLKEKAHEFFLEKFHSQLEEMEYPCVTYADSVRHDFNQKFKMRQSNEKILKILRPHCANEEYRIGLNFIWEDEITINDHGEEDYKNIAVIYFGYHGEPFLLFIDRQYGNLLEAFKAAGEEKLFQDWFYSKEVKREIIFHSFFKIYNKLSKKDKLTKRDIEHAEYRINEELESLKSHYGLTHDIQDAKNVYHEFQKERYDSPTDHVLETVFPITEMENEAEIGPREIIVLDLETTGTNPYHDSIIEIGICKLDLETGTIEPLFHALCNERNKEIDHDAWIFHHSDLSFAEVYHSRYLMEYRKEIQHLLNTYPVTAYNQDFDFSFLAARGFKIRKRFWDPMIEFTDLLKIPYNEYEYKWSKVEESWYYFFPNVKYPGRHRALEDSIIEALMISEYCRNHEDEDPKTVVSRPETTNNRQNTKGGKTN